MALWVSREPDTGFNLSIPRQFFFEIYEIGQLIIKAHYQATAKNNNIFIIVTLEKNSGS